MTEKDQADVVLSRKAVAQRYCLKHDRANGMSDYANRLRRHFAAVTLEKENENVC